MLNFTLKVLEIVQETPDTVTVVFKQPGLKKINYQAGQYLTLVFRINNRRFVRPYSFSSAPSVDPTLNVTVKRVPGGIVSNHIADCLKVGDLVEVMEPMGGFTLNDKGIGNNSHLVLWGAGSGITPLMSLVKFALNQQSVTHVTLVYGNRNHDYAIFRDQIMMLQKQHPEAFSVWHFHTQTIVDDHKPNVIQGRIDPKKVVEILAQENDLTSTFHYVCGPAGLKESVKNVLQNNGVAQANIFSEEFTLVVDPKCFEGIVTRNITVFEAEKSHHIEVAKGKTVLEAGLDAMIDLPYSCQTGNCKVCKGKLLSGSLRSITENAALKQELQADEYLLCCSLPETDDVVVSIGQP